MHQAKNRIEGYHEQKYTLICRFFKEFLDLIESYQHEDCRFLSLKSSLSGVEENSIQQDKIQQDKIQNTQYNIQYTNIQYIYSFCKDRTVLEIGVPYGYGTPYGVAA